MPSFQRAAGFLEIEEHAMLLMCPCGKKLRIAENLRRQNNSLPRLRKTAADQSPGAKRGASFSPGQTQTCSRAAKARGARSGQHT